jgi:predicted alpha/beta hydrolase family esterase
VKNVIVIHGYGETPESYWYPYLKKELEQKGYRVTIPLLPNTNEPTLTEQTDFILKNFEFNEDMILIGHSSGCPVILAVLEQIPAVISKAILVAGYTTKVKTLAEGTVNLKASFDFETIKNHCKEFIFINADNDPWGCDESQGELMHKELGGSLIINHEGHMGSDTYKQPYKQFPFLLALID